MKRLLWIPVFVLGVPLLGGGVPLAWVWIASRLQSSLSGVEVVPALAMVVGIPTTYVALTALAHRVSGRSAPARRHRDAWTRSLSSERHISEPTSAIENLFIATVVVVGVAWEVYLIFFAHPGVPAGPG